MAYAFVLSEGVADGTRRIAREGLKLAIDALEAAPGEAAVHEARRAIKRLRALVRLVRGAIGEEACAAANVALRDAARCIAAPRDAAVVLSTFDEIAAADASAAKIRAALRRRKSQTAREDRSGEAVERLRALVAAVDGWSFASGGWKALELGVFRAYRGARRWLARVEEEKSADAIHELRKRVKDLVFQTQLLRALWPRAMKAWERTFDRLGRRLGEDHDLAVLRATLLRHRGTGSFVEEIDRRRARILERALPAARRVLAERPRAYVERLAAWHRAAQEDRG